MNKYCNFIAEFLIEQYDNYILNESYGVSHTFDHIINELIDMIVEQLQDNSEVYKSYIDKKQDYIIKYSGYVYDSDVKKCIKSENNCINSFPIYLKYDLKQFDDVNYLLAIEGKDEYPNEIYILINYNELNNIYYNFETYNNKIYDNFEHFLYSKLKHEFLHTRCLYNYIDRDITNIPKYKSFIDVDDIKKFNFDNIERIVSLDNINQHIYYDFIYYIIDQLLYYFNPQEMDARANEVAGFLEHISEENKMQYVKQLEHNNKIIYDIMYKIDISHNISYMDNLINSIFISKNDFEYLSVDDIKKINTYTTLIIAYIFRKYRKYKPNKISYNYDINYINDIINKFKISNRDVVESNKFINYLKTTLNDYKFKIINIIYQILNEYKDTKQIYEFQI